MLIPEYDEKSKKKQLYKDKIVKLLSSLVLLQGRCHMLFLTAQKHITHFDSKDE